MTLSVGLILYRSGAGEPEVLVGHMGGPFFARKHEGGWSFPKGLADDGESPLAGAEREFAEEMGSPAPAGDSIDLGTARASGKTFHLFAREGDFDTETAVSNTFEIEWPRGSGTVQTFPEIDRAAWVSLDEAETLLAKGQRPFVTRLRDALG